MSYLSKEAALMAGGTSGTTEVEQKSPTDSENEDMWIYCSAQIERAAYGLVSNEAPYRNELNKLKIWFYSLPETEQKRIQKQVEKQLQLDRLFNNYNSTGSRTDNSMTSSQATPPNAAQSSVNPAARNKPPTANPSVTQTPQTKPSAQTKVVTQAQTQVKVQTQPQAQPQSQPRQNTTKNSSTPQASAEK